MTNDEVKNFLIQNGAYPDFEIVNAPIFDIYITNDNVLITKTLKIGTLMNINIETFINKYLNDTSKKWYVFNNCFDDIDITTTTFRFTNIDSNDRLLKYRENRINKILNKIYDK